jgi:nucleotide-binding universal stress UspA family protein
MTQGSSRSVLPPTEPSYAESPGQVIDRLEDELSVSLDGPARTIADAGIRVQRFVAIGTPADEITNYAVAHAVDAIVMCTHGRSGLSKALHGSVTAAVIGSGVAPVLVVRPRAK